MGITKGEVKIAELKEKVLEILGNLGITVYDEELMDTGATIDDIIEKIKEKLKQALLKAVDKIMDALNIADGKIREKVEDLIVKGKVKISELKEKVLEILKNLGVSTTADEALFLDYYEDVLLDEFVEDVMDAYSYLCHLILFSFIALWPPPHPLRTPLPSSPLPP